jgi:hypothetical protein
VLATFVAGLVTLVVTNSALAHAAVVTPGFALAGVGAILAGLRMRKEAEAARVPGRPRPWTEFVFPRWFRRFALGYLAFFASVAALGLVALIVAVAADALK